MQWTIFILVTIAVFTEVKGQVKNVQVLDTKSSFRQLNSFKPLTGLRKNTFSSNSKDLNDGKYHPEFHYGGEYLHDDSGRYIHDGTGNYNGDRGPQYQHLEPQSSIYQNDGNNNNPDGSNDNKYNEDNFNNQNQYRDNQDFGSGSTTSNSQFRSRSGFSSDSGSRFGSSSDSGSRFGSSSDSGSRFGSSTITAPGFNSQASGFNTDNVFGNNGLLNQNNKNSFGTVNGFNSGFAKATGNKEDQFANNQIKLERFGNSAIKTASPSKNSFGHNTKDSGNELDIGGTGSATVLSGQRASFSTANRGVSGKYEGGSRIIKQEGDGDYDGYHYLYETENGINAEEKGKVANRGSKNEAMKAKGFYTYTGPDNVVYTVEYISDENGFQPVGAHLPTPPPTPEAILKALELQKQLGVL